MSRLLILALAVIAVFAGFSAYQKALAQTAEAAEAAPKNNGKILIAYYSWSGHTKKVAEAIQEEIGGDLFEIQPETPYSDDYKTVVDQAKKEISDGYRPALKNNVENIAQYDTVFIGSPNWWGTLAPPAAAFLAEHGLAGRIVVPFCTYGGSGIEELCGTVARLCPQARVLSAFEAYGPKAKTGAVKRQTGKWLRRIGMIR